MFYAFTKKNSRVNVHRTVNKNPLNQYYITSALKSYIKNAVHAIFNIVYVKIFRIIITHIFSSKNKMSQTL